jgi:hypothetical protein
VDKNVTVINNGHRDFVYAGKHKSRKLRYICRLFCKEPVRHNFPGIPADELLERMIELSLHKTQSSFKMASESCQNTSGFFLKYALTQYPQKYRWIEFIKSH